DLGVLRRYLAELVGDARKALVVGHGDRVRLVGGSPRRLGLVLGGSQRIEVGGGHAGELALLGGEFRLHVGALLVEGGDALPQRLAFLLGQGRRRERRRVLEAF